MFFLRSLVSEVFDSSIPTIGVAPFLLINCMLGVGEGELWIWSGEVY
jgi:hypothetical protein